MTKLNTKITSFKKVGPIIIEVSVSKKLYLRIWASKILMRLAGKVLGCGCEVKFLENQK